MLAKDVLLDRNTRKRYDQHLRKTGGKHGDFKVVPEPPKQQHHDMDADFGSFFSHGGGFFNFEDLFCNLLNYFIFK